MVLIRSGPSFTTEIKFDCDQEITTSARVCDDVGIGTIQIL
jgi:hypothetical protein